jgi:hypothetical protein
MQSTSRQFIDPQASKPRKPGDYPHAQITRNWPDWGNPSVDESEIAASQFPIRKKVGEGFTREAHPFILQWGFQRGLITFSL